MRAQASPLKRAPTVERRRSSWERASAATSMTRGITSELKQGLAVRRRRPPAPASPAVTFTMDAQASPLKRAPTLERRRSSWERASAATSMTRGITSELKQGLAVRRRRPPAPASPAVTFTMDTQASPLKRVPTKECRRSLVGASFSRDDDDSRYCLRAEAVSRGAMSKTPCPGATFTMGTPAFGSVVRPSPRRNGCRSTNVSARGPGTAPRPRTASRWSRSPRNTARSAPSTRPPAASSARSRGLLTALRRGGRRGRVGLVRPPTTSIPREGCRPRNSVRP